MSLLPTLEYSNPNCSSSHRVQPSSMTGMKLLYRPIRGRLICCQSFPSEEGEKSPVTGSRQIDPLMFHTRLTTRQESVSEADRRPGCSSTALTAPVINSGVFNVRTSTPINSGSVCAVTSYGFCG